MTDIVVKRGTYGTTEIVNQAFQMAIPPKMGTKGLYVTVHGQPIGMDRKIRVLLDAETDVEFLHGGHHVTEETEEQIPEMPRESDEEIMDRMRKKFGVLDGMTIAAIEGHVRSMIVTGPPGVGKSFGVETILKSVDVMEKMTDEEIKQTSNPLFGMEKVATASPLGLYQLLYQYRNAGSVLVLDDSDSLLYDEASLNMLKAATDSGSTRALSWRTESHVLAGADIPSYFKFEGAIIFITNLDFENARGKIGDHLRAIVSRSHYLDMGIHDGHEKFLRCKQIVRDGMLTSYNFTDWQTQEILDYIEEHQGIMRELSLRMVKKIADLVRMDPTGWRDYADQTCLRGK